MWMKHHSCLTSWLRFSVTRVERARRKPCRHFWPLPVRSSLVFSSWNLPISRPPLSLIRVAASPWHEIPQSLCSLPQSLSSCLSPSSFHLLICCLSALPPCECVPQMVVSSFKIRRRSEKWWPLSISTKTFQFSRKPTKTFQSEFSNSPLCALVEWRRSLQVNFERFGSRTKQFGVIWFAPNPQSCATITVTERLQ